MSLSRVGLSALRGIRKSSSSAADVHKGYSKLNTLKEKYSLEDGTPIFQKSGAVDRVVVGFTLIACVVALGANFKTYYEFSLK